MKTESIKKTVLSSVSLIGQRCYGFFMSRQLQGMEFPALIDDSPQCIKKVTTEDSLLDMIYSVDPLTSLPTGDVALYLGKEVDPSIKRFIELNLHSPVTIGAETSGKFADISDDDVAELVRSSDEPVSSYINRVRDFFNSSQPKTSDGE